MRTHVDEPRLARAGRPLIDTDSPASHAMMAPLRTRPAAACGARSAPSRDGRTIIGGARARPSRLQRRGAGRGSIDDGLDRRARHRRRADLSTRSLLMFFDGLELVGYIYGAFFCG